MKVEFRVTKVEPICDTYFRDGKPRRAFEYAFLQVEMALPRQRLAEGLVLHLADGALYAVCSAEEGRIMVKKLSSAADPSNHVPRRKAGMLRGEGYVYGEVAGGL